MKRSKREENSIIIHFAFYFVLIAGLIIIIIISIIPQIFEIEEKKKTTKEIYEVIERIEKKGLIFEEFNDLVNIEFNNTEKDGKKDMFVLGILENMTENFYNKNLLNETNDTYSIFLKTKSENLNNSNNIAIVESQSKQISTILPSYSLSPINLFENKSNNLLTDYKFINYIESLMETFGLSTKSSIGIKKLELVKEYSGSNEKGDSLESNIYYIPLNLVFEGDKSGIINFLYYIENVGNVIIDDKEIKLNKDYGFLLKNGIKIILEGEKNTPDYNIFSHQMIDIQKISMDDYLDSSYTDRGKNDFKSFIKRNQGNDKFKINVNLLFYVKGQPAYKTEEFINNIFNKQKEALGIIALKLKNTEIKEIERNNLMKDKITLTQMNKEILSIRKNLVKKDELDKLYKSAIKLDSIIDPIFNSLK